MDKLFDFDPTPEELKALLGSDDAEALKAELADLDNSALIWRLFDMRGDTERRDHYAQFIDPDYLRYSLSYTDWLQPA